MWPTEELAPLRSEQDNSLSHVSGCAAVTWVTTEARAAAVAALLLAAGAGAQESPGYTIRDNVLRAETRRDWQGWSIAVGAATISPDGAVTPRFQRKHVDVAVEEGSAEAGSNVALAPLAFDGDPTTAWEPDLSAPKRDWWMELKLPRVVVVDSVVLRFVEEDLGQPFLQFLVAGWRHHPPLDPSRYVIIGTDISAFWEVYRTDRPNRTERRIAFVPRTTEKSNDAFEGDALEVLHIQVTDSEGLRYREVAEGTWKALAEADRGGVDYYRRSADGRQTLTTETIYRELGPGRQGRVRFFRRERPRLAEIEVWTNGDDLAHGVIKRGARNTILSRGRELDIYSVVTDGNPTSGPSFNSGGISYFLDLGTRFWVDAIDLLTDHPGGGALAYAIDLSDGSLAPDGSVLWRRNAIDERAEANFRHFAIEPTRVRYLRLRANLNDPISLTEVMLYGEGYVAEAVLTSPMIEIGGRRGLVAMAWDATTPPGTRIDIQTRTGSAIADSLVYLDSDGNIVTEERYTTRLPRVKKGPILVYKVPGPGFSGWCDPYAGSGEEIRSPRTERYLQIRARVVADTTSKYGPPAELRAIRIALADLYTDEIVGEVYPTRSLEVGVAEPRTFYLRPTYSNSEQGFDLIRIAATAPTELDVVDVAAGREADFRDGTARRFAADRIERQTSGRDTLLLQLPAMLRRGVERVEVRLRSTLYGHIAAFDAAVKASDSAGSWQLVEVGEAAAEVRSETNVVLSVEDNRLLSPLRVEPAAITPNGDGVGDAAVFRFELSRVTGPKEVRFVVHDLGGRRVRVLSQARLDPQGAYEVTWDGRDDYGDPVPPGTYLVRVAVDAESARADGTARLATVAVAY